MWVEATFKKFNPMSPVTLAGQRIGCIFDLGYIGIAAFDRRQVHLGFFADKRSAVRAAAEKYLRLSTTRKTKRPAGGKPAGRRRTSVPAGGGQACSIDRFRP